MRKKLYELIKPWAEETILGKAYDVFMIIVISMSMLPLMFKQQIEIFYLIDKIAAAVFILDYILRWSTADFLFKQSGIKPFIKYPFTPMAIIDLLTILPSLYVVHSGLRALRLIRLLRALKVIRVFKIVRYSKNVDRLTKVLKLQKNSLITVGVFAAGYILMSAILMFQAEPDLFENFFDAVYWATILLTTVGYGDLVATTVLGKAITMVASFLGIAIVALPAGIITAGYLQELHEEEECSK